MKSIDPTTGQVIKTYQEHSLEECINIVHQAEYAFQSWRRLSLEERSEKMRQMAVFLRRDKGFFAGLMAQEMGKPLKQGEGEIEKCAWVCEYFADEAKNYLADEIVKTDAKQSYIHYEPLGVILAVMPWNFPFWQVFRCAAPILMAGNSIVLKHASNVCGSALAIENLFKLGGFPDGLLRSVFINNEKVQKVIEEPLIRAITVTGSLGAGQAVASKAGAMVKKCVLELGGSDPYIILEDANLKEAAETCASSRMINAGQSCVSAKRFIVVKSVQEEFTNLFIANIRKQKMGAPMQEGVTLGPLARHDLRDQLHKQVQESIKKGARLLLGGEIPEGPGAFYPPTVLTDVAFDMPAYHEELFGPVASIISALDEQDALRLANDSVFGLGSAVFTSDLKRGQHLAVELQAGCCFVNESVKSDPRLPFGGIKQSGYGRELSAFGIREFVNVKTVYIGEASK